MKKYYTSIKFLCLFLVAVFLFQITASAGPITGTVMAEPINTEETLVEVTSLREESVKTFQKGNGNYVAAIYGEAVHYKDDDGNWQEIDNSLVPTTVSAARLADIGVNVTTANTSSVAYRKNASNPFEVNLPNTLTVNNPITVTYKGHTLGFSLQDMPLQSETVAEVVNTASKAETTQLEEYSIVSNDSVLSYGQVFPNTQLTYEMRGKKLKESLIFSAPPTQTTFTFRFYYEQLYPELLQTGEVQFYADNTKSGEPVFVIAAPYMFDSGEGYSAAVNVELVPVADGCLYKLTPDTDWLNAKERVYPVTLDPTVTTSLTQTEIHDNCVHQSDPNTNYINADRLYVGSVVLSSGTFESRTYIKFPRVSSIPTTAVIVNATMTLNHHANSSYQSGSNNTIDVYDCGNNAWGTSNITWNTQKNFVFTNRICYRVTDKSYSVEDFDVTTLVRSWYSTTASNNGLVIKPRKVYTNASNRTGYYSSDISSSISSKRPHITIEYTTTNYITGVPCEIRSTSEHSCIPTAITHLAAYWARNGYSGFGCQTVAQVEAKATQVHNTMASWGSNGNKVNNNIPRAFGLFTYSSGGRTVSLQAQGIWNGSWDRLRTEINAGRPLLLGFANQVYGIGHMTVCVGYYVANNGARYVIVSDAHNSHYVVKPYDENENDYIAPVVVIVT